MNLITKLWWHIVRFGFRLLYNEMAFTYDLVSYTVSLGQWRSWQRASIPLMEVEQGRVLEIAHGTGDLQLDLLEAGYTPVAYDLSPYMGRIAQRKLKRHNFEGVFICGQAQRLPFSNSSFDAILCTFPTSFILETETMEEARRVLRQDACFVIVLHGSLTGSGLIKRFVDFLYKITGQAASEPSEMPYFPAVAGYDMQEHDIDLGRSRLRIVVLRKLSEN